MGNLIHVGKNVFCGLISSFKWRIRDLIELNSCPALLALLCVHSSDSFITQPLEREYVLRDGDVGLPVHVVKKLIENPA